MHRGKKALSLHLTDLCNNNCLFCVVGIPQRLKELDLGAQERIRRRIVEGAKEGYELVNIHGGEPTVSDRLLDTLDLIRDCGYPEVHLQTNGRRLMDAIFVRRLRELNVTLFIVSMHGRTAATHDALTGAPGGFAQTVRGISNAKLSGARVQTNTVVARQNLGELAEMVDWLVDLGVDHVNISNLHPAETAYLNFEAVTPSVAEMRPAVGPAVARAVARGVPVTLEGFPFCALPGLEAHHLSRTAGAISVEIRGSWIENYEQFMDDSQRIKGDPCRGCPHFGACAGVYKSYVEKRGWSEFHAAPDGGIGATA